jgi:multidrug resistance efflux pump
MSDTPISAKRDPVRGLVLGLVGLAIALFVYTLVADRMTPSTSQATAQAFLIRMAPEVGGRVISVDVSDNDIVKPGDLLFRLDPRPYEIVVAQAEARVAQVGQTLGASTAAVETAQARVAEALAARSNTREQTARVLELVRRGVYPPARGEDAQASLARADATLQAAVSELERARQNLGPAGAANPQLRDALSALERAQLDLLRTRVVAPSTGVVTNLNLSPGSYLAPGQAALTFIDGRAYWVSALMRENNLEHMRPGTLVEMVFDALPGRVFAGRVESIGWGLGGTAPVDQATGLLSPTKPNNDTRRFPVTLLFNEQPPVRTLRYGSQASIVAYAVSHPVMDAIAAAVIRLRSVLAYLS